jgi:hypothetical protein
MILPPSDPDTKYLRQGLDRVRYWQPSHWSKASASNLRRVRLVGEIGVRPDTMEHFLFRLARPHGSHTSLLLATGAGMRQNDGYRRVVWWVLSLPKLLSLNERSASFFSNSIWIQGRFSTQLRSRAINDRQTLSLVSRAMHKSELHLRQAHVLVE